MKRVLFVMLVLWSALACSLPAQVGEREKRSTDAASPGDFLARDGFLQYPVAVSIQGIVGAQDGGGRGHLGARITLVIAREGAWTTQAFAGVGVANRGGSAAVAVITAPDVGQFDQTQIHEVAAILADNDLAHLRSYSFLPKTKMPVSGLVGYQVSVMYGRRKFNCTLRQFSRNAQDPSVTNIGNPELRTEVTDRYTDLCIRLFAMTGITLDENGKFLDEIAENGLQGSAD